MQDTLDTETIVAAIASREESTVSNPQPLRTSVEQAMQNYFSQLDDTIIPTDLYELVIAEVEAPLIESVLRRTGGNQTKAAAMLGLSRGTLRKLIEKYSLDKLK